MRILLTLWLAPIFCLLVWYGLSYNDWNFGTTIFSRQLHDLVFGLYGKILGVDPSVVPIMAAKAIALDSLIVVAIIAYRLRKKWWPAVSGLFTSKDASALPPAAPAPTVK
ncbi:MAG: DUF6105 family protein [Pseudomonadota bacterium]